MISAISMIDVKACEGGHQMAQVDWYIEGAEVSNCNCDYACPCQFESPGEAMASRVRIDLPNGIEFESAEIGSGTTKTMASVALDLTDTYCHFTVLRRSGKGVVHSR
jgi:hypothetical protein